MPLTNPAAIIHQNLIKSMEMVKPSAKKAKTNGLLTPTRPVSKANENDIDNPINRVATYVDTIRRKREELKENGS